MSDTVLLDVDNGVATVTLNRPDRLNALDVEIRQTLARITREVSERDDVAVVVLTGAGRGFCTGGDIKVRAESARAGAPARELVRGEWLRSDAEASRLLREMPKVTIAMVNGPVAGAGIGLAGACDLRLAAESATFLSAFDRIGGSGDYGSTFVWTRILGAAKAREIFLLGETYDARAALAFGLYHRVYPDAELRERTFELARRLASGPRASWAYIKRNLNAAEEEPFSRHLDSESAHMSLSTTAYAQAMKAKASQEG